MDPVTLANLLAQLIPLGINVYTQIQQANSDKLKPIEEILSAADSNWDAITKSAQVQISAATPEV
jgi:hypothetical protein